MLSRTSPLRYVLIEVITRHISKMMYGHGIGRHSPEEIVAIGRRDWTAISQLLGDKPFMFGDQPTRLDATVFSFVCNLVCELICLVFR